MFGERMRRILPILALLVAALTPVNAQTDALPTTITVDTPTPTATPTEWPCLKKAGDDPKWVAWCNQFEPTPTDEATP